MVRHDAKVVQPEAVLFFCVFQGKKHNFPAPLVFKSGNFVISTGRYMVRRSLNDFSFLSHSTSLKKIDTLYRARTCVLLDCFQNFLKIFSKVTVTDWVTVTVVA